LKTAVWSNDRTLIHSHLTSLAPYQAKHSRWREVLSWRFNETDLTKGMQSINQSINQSMNRSVIVNQWHYFRQHSHRNKEKSENIE